MTIEQLTKIIKEIEIKAIESRLKELGYVDCTHDKKYKHISLVTLYNGDTQETEDILYDNDTKALNGAIITNVQGYERVEFIEVSFMRIMPTVFEEEEKTAIEEKSIIYAKENGQG